MTARQQAQQKEVGQVILVYKEKKEDFETVPALAAGMEDLILIDEQIDETVEQQVEDTTGTTKSKTDMKAALALSTCKIAGSLSSWAKKNNNAVVLAQSNTTIPKITKLNDKLIGPNCRNILSLATANLDALADYGVTADTLQQFKLAIDAYVALSEQPRKKILNRGGITKKLAELFAAADELQTETIDKLMLNLLETKPDTYKSYQAARVMPQPATAVKVVVSPTDKKA